ncbi:MAG: nucleotide exchange factor GrpE [Acidobacteriota bacterium]
MSKDNNAPDAEDSNPEIIEIVGLDDAREGSDTAEPERVGVADEDDPAAVSGSPNLEDLRRENAEIQERLLRKHADVENMRKRMEREKAEFVRFAAVDLVRKLLPVIDNLERALEAPADTGGDGLREGVRLVHQELQSILEREGLKVVEAKGKPFDPNLHEAVLREESTEIDSEQVIEEFQKGFVFRDRLLRPAMVKVAVPAVAQERNVDDPPKPGGPVTDPKEG